MESHTDKSDMERAQRSTLMKKGGKTASEILLETERSPLPDILKGRLKKGKKKSMDDGVTYVPRPGMAPMEMRRIDVAGKGNCSPIPKGLSRSSL